MTDWASRPGCHLITRARSTRAADWMFLGSLRRARLERQIEKRHWNHRLASVLCFRSSCQRMAVLSDELREQGQGRVAEWFKAPVLKTGRGFTLPRGFESHPFRHNDRARPIPSRSVARRNLDKIKTLIQRHSDAIQAGLLGRSFVRRRPTQRTRSPPAIKQAPVSAPLAARCLGTFRSLTRRREMRNSNSASAGTLARADKTWLGRFARRCSAGRVTSKSSSIFLNRSSGVAH